MKATTILFADIAGSSTLYKEKGDAVAKIAISGVLSLLERIIQDHHGRVVKTIGDEVMAQFNEPNTALSAAIDMQQACDKNPVGLPLPIRIGFHHGMTIQDDDDLFGEAVNDTATLIKTAKARQTLTTDETLNLLDAPLQNLCTPLDTIGIQDPTQSTSIYLVDWEHNITSANATLLVDSTNTGSSLEPLATMTLVCGERRYRLDPTMTPFVAGRDSSQSHLILDQATASRDHFHIEYNRGKFVLVDKSTNGTTVFNNHEDAVYLRREETILSGQGKIAIGKRVDGQGLDNIQFQVSK